MSYSLPPRIPPRFSQHQHFRALVTYIFTAIIAICISFLTLPRWGCKKFNVDCFSPVSATISPWNPVAQAEEQQPCGTTPHTKHLPTLQVLQPPGAQASVQLQPHHLPRTQRMELGPAGRSHSICSICLPLRKKGVKGRKYRGKGNKNEKERVSK